MAFKSNAVWPAVDTGFKASVVLSTLPKPIVVLTVAASPSSKIV